jgi:hypothetical protein
MEEQNRNGIINKNDGIIVVESPDKRKEINHSSARSNENDS